MFFRMIFLFRIVANRQPPRFGKNIPKTFVAETDAQIGQIGIYQLEIRWTNFCSHWGFVARLSWHSMDFDLWPFTGSIYLPVVVLPEQCQKRYVISPHEALINRKAYLSCVSDHQKYLTLFIFVHVELLNISKKLLLLTFNNIILKVSIHF